jgi:hypothetical protein
MLNSGATTSTFVSCQRALHLNPVLHLKYEPFCSVNELLAKIIAHNLTEVIHEMYETGIEPRLPESFRLVRINRF